jgi:hypothetical protein
MRIEEIRDWMKMWIIKTIGDIPRAYPFDDVYACAIDPKLKSVIDTSTPIIAESITFYINFDDPFARHDDDYVFLIVDLPDGTTIACTPANFLQPECISTYYRRSFARLFLDSS